MTALRGRLIVVALVTAVAELVLLRVALRLGPVLPTQVNVLPAFALVERLGVVALNLGVLAGSVVIGLAALDAIRSRPRRVILAAALLGAILVNLGLQVLVGMLPAGSVAAVHGAVTGAAVLLTVLSASQLSGLRIVLLLVGMAQVLALAQGATQSLGMLGGALPVGGRPIVLSEVVAVVAALALPWLTRARPRSGEVLVGVAAGLGVTGAALVQPWGLATVAIWTMAFSLFLPPILYGAAVTSILVTGLALRRQPGGGELAAGLALVWLAGLKLDVSSYALMALAGLVIASRAAETLAIGAEVSVASPSRLSVAGLRRPIS